MFNIHRLEVVIRITMMLTRFRKRNNCRLSQTVGKIARLPYVKYVKSISSSKAMLLFGRCLSTFFVTDNEFYRGLLLYHVPYLLKISTHFQKNLDNKIHH